MNVAENHITAAHDGVRVVDGFLSKNDFIRVQNWALSVSCELTREERRWDMMIVRNFSECYSSRQWRSTDDDMPAEARLFVDAAKQSDMIDDDATIVVGVLRWQRNSGMGEHADAHTHTAMTYYLNDIWNDNWFGDLVFYESAEDYKNGYGRSVSPKANRLVINRDTVFHKVTYCSELAVERITVQAFVLKE
ncbi:MAG: 2OG-Fe(II) oxygenase [Gammaproteobacteria bacterium]|nr:2OG-Fe(II) oxygenase [Gammaproteobacteria bacterium]NND53575.1 2OG-Fe(II) oxygenase [Gammaproteobacteria bacterium]